jgi:hypothetical protein
MLWVSFQRHDQGKSKDITKIHKVIAVFFWQNKVKAVNDLTLLVLQHH